jgi:ADP-heptose:LPS heptosyltransferase
MTAAIYSLHRAYPGRYVTAVDSLWPEVFEHNPDVEPREDLPYSAAELQMHYPAIHQSNHRGIHFMQGWTEFLGMALGVNVPLLTNRPHLYFADPAPPVEDFWLVCSGGKSDFTNKLWGHYNYQEVVDRLSGIRFVQVGRIEDNHPLLDRVDCARGATLRGLFDLTRRARGVLCGVSLLMHVAAALEKPAVVIAGGREPVTWNSYPKQHYLHTVGVLPCSDTQGYVGGGCWRSRTVPLGDGTVLDKDTCERPVGWAPECMTLIHPAEVVELVLRYDRQYQ